MKSIALKVLLAAFSYMWVTVSLGQSLPVHIKAGMKFSEVHNKLNRQGWRPVIYVAGHGREDIGVERVLKATGVQGVESCSVDGPTFCILNYKRKGECLRIITAGESLKELRVREWKQTCPSS